MRPFLATALLLAACAAPAKPPPEPPAPVDLERCGEWDGVYDYLDVEPGPARQGSTIRIYPRQWRGPALHVVPLDCTSNWTVSDPALAGLSDDRATVRIADTATPGATVTVSYRIKGKPIGASFIIVARDAFVLTGRRGQSALEGCDGLLAVGELEFTAEGRFSVTWRPFETYKDYWGTYRLDPATGALSMTVEGGNDHPPSLDLEGKARFAADGKLVLEDMFLGQPSWSRTPPPAAGACRYRFG
jgi:hypothetical protein